MQSCYGPCGGRTGFQSQPPVAPSTPSPFADGALHGPFSPHLRRAHFAGQVSLRLSCVLLNKKKLPFFREVYIITGSETWSATRIFLLKILSAPSPFADGAIPGPFSPHLRRALYAVQVSFDWVAFCYKKKMLLVLEKHFYGLPALRLELRRYCYHWILSPECLPFHQAGLRYVRLTEEGRFIKGALYCGWKKL